MRERKRACDLLREPEESGNIASSISVLLLEAARPPEQQEDASMKTLVGVAFAASMVLPLFAPSQATVEPSHFRAYPEQKKQLRAAHRGLDGSASNSNRPKPNAEPAEQWLCSTAPAFCPDYHGDNGS
jgi:hypothetical protein